MKHIFGTYIDGREAEGTPNLPDNAGLLREHRIYSFDSADAQSWSRRFREKVNQGDTVYLLGFQGVVHNSGLSLVEASRAGGVKLLANYEEERFAGEKHFAGYPQHSIEEMKTLFSEIGITARDIFCVNYGWDLVQLEKNARSAGFSEEDDRARYLVFSVISREAQDDAVNPKRRNFYVYSPLLIKHVERLRHDLSLSAETPCIQMLHHENHAWLSYGSRRSIGRPVRSSQR